MKNMFGIPCSLLKDRIEEVDVNCTSEEEAFALAVGAWFAGKKPTVYMQSDGFVRCLNIILTLYKPYRIPPPKLILSIRHKPLHHHFVGEHIKKLLELTGYCKVEVVEERKE